jgi:hypothetical protein
MIVSIGISLVILILVCVGVGFSFECLIDLGGLCNLIARAVLVAVFTAAYFTLKVSNLIINNDILGRSIELPKIQSKLIFNEKKNRSDNTY